jgi:hypothetical protein
VTDKNTIKLYVPVNVTRLCNFDDAKIRDYFSDLQYFMMYLTLNKGSVVNSSNTSNFTEKLKIEFQINTHK